MKGFDNIDFDGMKIEAIGVFSVVYMGGWAYINYFLDTNDFISVGVTHMFTYALFTWAGFFISGGVFNPALGAVLIFFKRLDLIKGLFYILSQITGSLLAASLLKLLSPEATMNMLKKNENMLGYPSSSVNFVYVAVYELIGTFLVVFIYYLVALTKEKTNTHVYGIAMGSVYFVNILIYGKYTGGASNIARVIGPALISKDYLNLLSSSLGSICGAFLAGFLCEFVILKDLKEALSRKEADEEAKELGMGETGNDINSDVIHKEVTNDDSFGEKKGDISVDIQNVNNSEPLEASAHTN